MAFWHSKAFIALQNKWYDKLKRVGFVDIESSPTHMHLETARSKDREAVQQHYENARAYLHIGKFSSKEEKRIWQLYSEGASLREIGKKMKISKDTANKFIKIHLLRMKVIMWADPEND